MADKYFNPFAAIDIYVPTEFHPDVVRFCQSGGNPVDQSPFPRMVDLWFAAVCVAARLNLKPAEIGGDVPTTKIIDGAIFGSDPWRVHTLMLLAIGKTGDVQIVSEPRKIMNLASGLAAAGLPKVIEMLKDGDGEAIWNLSEAVDGMLRKKSAA